jgi:hypothetical protein
MRQKNAREQITRCIMMSRIVPASTSAERCQQSSSLLGGEENDQKLDPSKSGIR